MWASGLSLAAEQSIGWGPQAWIGRLYKWTFCGHVQSGQVGLPLLLNVSCNFTKSQVGTRSLEVLLSMLYVVWRNHHTSWATFWKNLNLSLPSLVVLCPRHEGWGATGAMLLADGKRPLRYTNNPSEQRST